MLRALDLTKKLRLKVSSHNAHAQTRSLAKRSKTNASARCSPFVKPPSSFVPIYSVNQGASRVCRVKLNPLLRVAKRSYVEGDAKEQVTLEQEFRTHLKGFLMRVHPDFFSSHPYAQEQNDKSLKQLNSLLDIVEDYSKKAAGPIQLDQLRVPGNFTVRFYLRHQQKSAIDAKREAEEKLKPKEENRQKDEKELMPKRLDQEFVSVAASYYVPEHYYREPFSRELLERDIRMFLNDLLKQAGLPQMAINDVAEDESNPAVEAQFDDDGDFHPKYRTSPYRDAQALRKEFKSVLAAFMDRHYPEAQIAIDKLGPDWGLFVGIKPEAGIAARVTQLHHSSDRERKQLHYAPDLDGEERATGLLLVEELWANGSIPADIPIYITREPNVFLLPSVLPGFLSIPLEFENEDLRAYLSENLKSIMITRYNMRGQIQENEYLVKQLTQALALGVVDLRASLENSLICLTALNGVKDELVKQKKHIEGMTWRIVEPEEVSSAMEAEKRGRDSMTWKRPESDVDASEPTPSAAEMDNSNFEKVDGLAISRRKITFTQEQLDATQKLRAERAAANPGFSDDWEDDEDESIVSEQANLASSLVSDLLKHPERHEDLDEEAKVLDDIEEDEFVDAMKKAQREQAGQVNAQLVYAEGTPWYSLRKDILYIPYNTSGATLLAWVESNEAILHFRQKIFPSKEWTQKLQMICRNLSLMIGAKTVSFSGRTLWDKSVQLSALRNLDKMAPLLRTFGLNNLHIVITQASLSINIKKKILKIPHNLTERHWAAFLRHLRSRPPSRPLYKAEL